MRKLTYSILFTFFSVMVVHSQPLDREVLVTKDYVPIIQDAKRITQEPEIDDSIQIKPGFRYRIYPIAAKTSFEIKQIKPARLTGIPVSELYNYHIKAGLGNHHLPMINVHANNLRSNDYLVGVMLDVENLEGRVKLDNNERINASKSAISLMAYGKKFLGGFSLEGNAGVDLNKIHYYGLTTDSVFDPLPKAKDIRQNYNTLFGGLNFFSTNSEDVFRANLGIDERYTWDRFNNFENDISVNLFTGTKVKFLDFHLDMELQALNNNLLGDSSVNSSYFNLTPYILNRNGDLKYTIGINFMLESIDGQSNTYLYPKAAIEYAIAGPVLATFFTLSGKLQTNTYRETLEQNPYIKPGIIVKPADNRLMAVAGIKGTIIKGFTYNLSGELSNIKNKALFVIDTVGVYDNYYKVVYGDVDIIRIGATVDYTIKNKFKISLSGNKYTYDAGEQEYAWHLPEWNADMLVSYNLQNKVTFTGILDIMGTRYVQDLNESTVKLNPFAVFDLNVDYHFSKVFGAFLNLKNLNASQYDIWYQYPWFKTMVVLGVSYKF